jgi:hypothetical protein
VLVINRHSSHDAPIDKIFYHSISVILTSEKRDPFRYYKGGSEFFPCSPTWQGHICENLGMVKEQIKSVIYTNSLKLINIMPSSAWFLLTLILTAIRRDPYLADLMKSLFMMQHDNPF